MSTTTTQKGEAKKEWVKGEEEPTQKNKEEKKPSKHIKAGHFRRVDSGQRLFAG